MIATAHLAVLYLDFAKAFDTVPHARLINKLATLGIGGKLLKLIDSYFSARHQFFKINNSLSGTRAVESGVLQGSILGPLLFLLFIYIFPVLLQDILSFGYADEFGTVVSNQKELIIVTTEMVKWLNENQIKPNIKKTHSLNIKSELSASVLDNCIEPCKEQIDLGLIVNWNLTWNSNCH